MPHKGVVSNETSADVSRDVQEMFLRAEQTGLKLAIIGRTAALVLLGIWVVVSRGRDPAREARRGVGGSPSPEGRIDER